MKSGVVFGIFDKLEAVVLPFPILSPYYINMSSKTAATTPALPRATKGRSSNIHTQIWLKKKKSAPLATRRVL